MAPSSRYVKWSLAPGTIEPHTALGDLRIEGETGVLEEKETLLDSYFLGLLEGLARLRGVDRVSVDVIVEPWPIELEREGSRLVLLYRGTTTQVRSPSALEEELRQCARELIAVLDRAAGEAGTERPVLTELRAAATEAPGDKPSRGSRD